MTILTRTLVLPILLLSLAGIAISETKACIYPGDLFPKDNEAVPLEVENLDLTPSFMPYQPVLKDALVTSMREGIVGGVTMVNKSRKKIRYFLVVIELVSTSGAKVSVPIFNVTLPSEMTPL